MKKVLLATTILGMSAGFAAAESHSAAGIAFTGEATAGFASVNGGDIDGYSSFKLGVAATGTSDSGLSFGASFSTTAGQTFDFDGADSAIDAEDGTFGAPTVFISGDFGKLAFSVDGFDNYSNDDFENNDIEYTHTIAGVSIGVRTDVISENGVGGATGDSSLKLGYTAGAVKLGLVFDQLNEDYKVSAGYEAGAFTIGLAVDEADVATLNVDYEANGISAGLEIDSEEAYTLSAGYEANGLSIGAEIDDASVWELTAGYDLGGGLEVEAGIHESESAYLGAVMKF